MLPTETRYLVVCFLALCACAIGGLGIWRDSSYESPTFLYPTLSNTVRAQAIGWMPGFLPPSATNIREKRHYGDNARIIAFDFNPADFPSFSRRFISVPTSRQKDIQRPRRVRNQEAWFPKAILEGEWDRMVAQGFSFYQITESKHSRRGLLENRWFAAIHPQKGTCYVWCRGDVTEGNQ
jgi:hypothetical protein